MKRFITDRTAGGSRRERFPAGRAVLAAAALALAAGSVPMAAGEAPAGAVAAGEAPDAATVAEAAVVEPVSVAAPVPAVNEVRYGPFLLAPAGAGGDLDHANVFLPDVPKPCEDCFIVGAEPNLVYPDGTSANLDTGVMLHHAVFFNTGRHDATCGSDRFFGRLGERFLASGNERTPRRYPEGFGYHLGRDRVNAVFHVMNHSPEPKTVYFTYKFRWVPASTPGVRPITPVWLDMNNCRTSEYPVPAGPSSRHWQWTSTITGRIVSTGGHVHDGGVRTTLSNATTGRHVCTSWAGYGTDPAYRGSIESMSVCVWDALGTVRAGEVLDLEAFYDSSDPVDGAMGIMVAHIYETPDLDSGTVPPPETTGAVRPAGSTPPPSGGHHRHH